MSLCCVRMTVLICVCVYDARVFECVCMCMSKCVSGMLEHVSAFV